MTTREHKPTVPLRANRPSQPPPAPSPFTDRVLGAVDDLREKIARVFTLTRTTEEFAGNHNLRGDELGDAQRLEHLLEVTTESCESALRDCDELLATLRGVVAPPVLAAPPASPNDEQTRETNAVDLDAGQAEP